MGTSQSQTSTPVADAYQQQGCGYRILGIQENSPISAATTDSNAVIVFFDFIVAANGVPLTAADNTLVDMLLLHEDKPMQLTIYNTKCSLSRVLQITPSRHWPGEGLLGITIRFDTFYGTSAQNYDEGGLIRVLSVDESSPAANAGIEPLETYLLGTPEIVFSSVEALQHCLLQHIDNSVEIYTYSTSTDEISITSLTPTKSKLLGAELGIGFLHVLPASLRQTPGKNCGKQAYKAEIGPFGLSTNEEHWNSRLAPATAAIGEASTCSKAAVDKETEQEGVL